MRRWTWILSACVLGWPLSALPHPETAPASTAAPDVGSGATAPRLSVLWEEARPTLALRARIEHADEDGRDESVAYTGRLRLGAQSGIYRGFQGFVEFEHTDTPSGSRYNAAGVSGPLDKTVIADPESTELNRAWLSWSHDRFGSFKLGRQRIILDNARFVGNVGWRQNEQTFDGFTLNARPTDALSVFYGFVYKVDRIFGSEADERDFDAKVHLAHVTFASHPLARLQAYGYWLDLENDGTGTDAGSSLSYGVSLTGGRAFGEVQLDWRAELASQRDAADHATDYRAPYYHLNGKLGFKGFSLGLGREVLGEENGVGFATPLATLHKFNGFADKFLATPSDGLEDNYLSASAPLPLGLNLQVVYHDFEAEGSGRDYGSEWNFALSRKLRPDLTILAKAAVYDREDNAPNFALRDTTRLWLQAEWSWQP